MTVTASYTYDDGTGKRLARVDRVEPSHNGKSKEFFPYLSDAEGGFCAKPGLNGTRLPLYRRGELLACREGGVVFLAEGEGKADALRAALRAANDRACVTTIAGGASAPIRPEHVADFAGFTSVLVLPDADTVGRTAAQARAKRIADAHPEIDVRICDLFPGTSDGRDIADWLAAGHAIDELRALVFESPRIVAEPAVCLLGVESLNVTPWERIAIEPVRWLMPDVLPLAEATVVEGAGGIGKTTAVLDILARLSRGDEMPDGTPCEAANALIIASEEDSMKTLKARLLACGANLDRIALVASVGADEHWLTLPTDAPAILAAVRDRMAKVVFIDALFSHFADDLSPNKSQDARRVLRPLSAIAHETGAAILAIRHWGKTARSAADRGLGSSDIRNVARSVLTVGEHPSEERRFVVAVSKTNLGKNADALTYKIESAEVPSPQGFVSVGRIVWGDRARISADDLANTMLPNAEEQTRAEVAVDFLTDKLSDGPVASDELYAEAKRRGLSATSLKRGATRLGVLRERSGFPARTAWRLQPGQQSAHTRITSLTGPTGPTEASQASQLDQTDQIDHSLLQSRARASGLTESGKICSTCKRIDRCYPCSDGGFVCSECRGVA